MNIRLIPINDTEMDEVFSLVKRELYSYIDAVSGWDDAFQRRRLETEYQPDWFYWISIANERAGLVCFKPYNNAYHVHFLIVESEQQSKGTGRLVMEYLHKLAYQEQRDSITLSSFVPNSRAISFYKNLGYQITDSEDDFVSMTLSISKS